MTNNGQRFLPDRLMSLGSFEPDFDEFRNFTEYKRHFIFDHAPTEEEIVLAQKEAIKDLAFISNAEKGYFKRFNKDYENGATGVNASADNSSFSAIIEEKITKIENDFLDLGKKYSLSENATEADIVSYKARLNQLINNYRTIIDTYSETQEGMVQPAIKKLEKNIDILEGEVAAKFPAGIKSLQIEGKSLIRSLAGISSAITGAELEIAGTKYANDHKPKRGKGYKAYQLGDVKVKVDAGGAVDIKEDIGIFDAKMDNAIWDTQIELANNKVKTLRELAKNDFKGIVLSKKGYETLQNAMFLAISAKAGRSKNFSLHTGLTINRIYEWLSNPHDSRIWSLYHWAQLYDAGKFGFTMKGKTLSATFNYAMSHVVPNVIGKKNKIFLTRKGFETSYEFLTRVLDSGARVKAYGVALDKGARVTVPNV